MTQPARVPTLAFGTNTDNIFLLNLQFDGEPGISRGVATFERLALSDKQALELAADLTAHFAGRAVP